MESMTIRRWKRAGQPEGWQTAGQPKHRMEALRILQDDDRPEIAVVLMRHPDGLEREYGLSWDVWLFQHEPVIPAEAAAVVRTGPGFLTSDLRAIALDGPTGSDWETAHERAMTAALDGFEADIVTAECTLAKILPPAVYSVWRDGRLIDRFATETAAARAILDRVPYSVSHAVEHEGWRIESAAGDISERFVLR